MAFGSYSLVVYGQSNETYPDGTVTQDPKDQTASAEPLGGGVFLTAAHPFDEYTSTTDEFKYDQIALAAIAGDPNNPGIPAKLSGLVGSYNPKTLGPDDLAVVVAPGVSGPTAGLYPIVAFADDASAAAVISWL